jgi:hypothetical protein
MAFVHSLHFGALLIIGISLPQAANGCFEATISSNARPVLAETVEDTSRLRST